MGKIKLKLQKPFEAFSEDMSKTAGICRLSDYSSHYIIDVVTVSDSVYKDTSKCGTAIVRRLLG